MPRNKSQLPTKRQFYNKLNEFIEEAYQDILVRIPEAGQNIYKNKHGGPLKRHDKGLNVPPNSGRLRAAIQEPGRIHMRGFGPAKAGKISFRVKNETLYDPVFQEHYWTKVAYNAKTDFGNTNYLKGFWKGAAKQLKGKLITYKNQYATYKPSWMGRLTTDELAELEATRDVTFLSLLGQAMQGGII